MLQLSHHGALAASYATAVGLWVLLRFVLPRAWTRLWPAPQAGALKRPWLDTLLMFVAVLAIIGIGQLYQHDLLLPRSLPRLAREPINQLIIFSPLFVLLAVRRQSLRTAWLPLNFVWARILIGLGLALIALWVFSLTRLGADSWPTIVNRLLGAKTIEVAVQVLLEDIAIAMMLVRLGAATGRPRISAICTAALFAGAHIPSMLSNGATGADIASLLLDFALASGVLLAVQHGRDVWWFWCVHTAMDMTQFIGGPS